MSPLSRENNTHAPSGGHTIATIFADAKVSKKEKQYNNTKTPTNSQAFFSLAAEDKPPKTGFAAPVDATMLPPTSKYP